MFQIQYLFTKEGWMLKKYFYLSFSLLTIAITGCSSTGSYSSNETFTKSIIGPIEKMEMEYQGPFRNPVIIVHGFLGVNLVDRIRYWRKSFKC